MKKLFVNYEIAILLKEKGFNENCLGTYLTNKSVKEGKFYPAEPNCDITDEFDSDGYLNFVVIKNSDLEDVPQYAAAPLYQQVIDWFRKVHKIEVNPCKVKSLDCYHFYVYPVKDGKCAIDWTEVMPVSAFDTYEEARIKAIEKALTYI